MFPGFQPKSYIHNGTQLFRILKRDEDPRDHRTIKLWVEDAYRYNTNDLGDRVYATRWLTYDELVAGQFRRVAFRPAELPARFRVDLADTTKTAAA